MKADLLDATVRAQAEKRPVVLLRSLDSAEQWLLDPSESPDRLEGLSESLRTRCYEALKRDGASVVESDGRRYLLQTISPPYRLIVIGAVHIAQALVPMARTAGYAATLVDPRPAFATPERFPGIEIMNAWPQDVMDELSLTSRTAVVTLSHDPKIDEPALAAALRSDAFYIGALGSKRNHAGRLERLTELGFDAATLERVAGPVGLDLGGRAPAEIAVAILAQIIKARYARGEQAS
ncbi:MAG: XdhC family protein [Gammaproteobacteria bacterium]|nr:XdhC family protein [Gammaproteobacteria bacterium]